MSLTDAAGGNCMFCAHNTSEWDRSWCEVYGIWIVSPSRDGDGCPAFEEAPA